MSHVAKIEIEIRDLAALKAAATRIGGRFLEGQTTYRWFGEHVGDYPLPTGFKVSDLGKCEHAISVPGASYEVGVVRRRDGKPGYTLIWDFWQSGGLQRALGRNGDKLIQAYGVEASKRAARRAGYSVTESTKADGTVVITAQTGAR